MSTDPAQLGPGSQPPDEESVPGASVLPADPSVRGRPQTGLHLTQDLHLQGENVSLSRFTVYCPTSACEMSLFQADDQT